MDSSNERKRRLVDTEHTGAMFVVSALGANATCEAGGDMREDVKTGWIDVQSEKATGFHHSKSSH
jgi:hypothetical protein